MTAEHDHDDLIAAIADELRRPVTFSPGFDARVMAEVRRTRREGWLGSRVRWLVEPRSVRISPLGGLATAAGLATLILLSGRVVAPDALPDVPAAASGAPTPELAAPRPAAPSGAQTVQFVLAAPGASQVTLVGTFNDWDPSALPLVPTASGGVWSVTVPLPAGRHEYAFVVDGTTWVADPAAPPAPANDFGTPNSVLTLTERAS